MQPFPELIMIIIRICSADPVKLKKDTDVYISTGYSAADCISFIHALLKKYQAENIDIEDIEYEDADIEESTLFPSSNPYNIRGRNTEETNIL